MTKTTTYIDEPEPYLGGTLRRPAWFYTEDGLVQLAPAGTEVYGRFNRRDEFVVYLPGTLFYTRSVRPSDIEPEC